MPGVAFVKCALWREGVPSGAIASQKTSRIPDILGKDNTGPCQMLFEGKGGHNEIGCLFWQPLVQGSWHGWVPLVRGREHKGAGYGDVWKGPFQEGTEALALAPCAKIRTDEDAFLACPGRLILDAKGKLCKTFRRPGIFQSTRILHTGSLSLTDEPARSATYAAIRIAKAAGAIISYDPNYRASLWPSQAEACRAMASLIPWADILKLSQEEVALLTGENDPQAAAWALRRQGVAVVAVTLGKMGALVLAGQETSFVPAYPARAVDATGAGDAFFGGFLYRFLEKGRSPQALTIGEAVDCARFGNATASLCVEGGGKVNNYVKFNQLPVVVLCSRNGNLKLLSMITCGIRSP